MASAADSHLDDTAARITAYEDSVRNAARARVGSDLAQIQAQLRAEVAAAGGDTQRLLDARRRAAQSLRALRPAVAPILRQAISEGVRLGASLAGGPVPAGVKPHRDPAVKAVLQKVNTPIRRHARLSAAAVSRMPLRTERQLEAVLDRIAAVLSEVDAATGVITSRAVDIGQAAVLDERGDSRVWVTRTGCCPVCASHSGSVAGPGGLFHPRASYADHEGQWVEPAGGSAGPPIHSHCRCYTVTETRGLADRLARKTEADVAAGRVTASMPARIRAVERMLATDRNLTQKTRERALRAAARGRVGAQRASQEPQRRRSA